LVETNVIADNIMINMMAKANELGIDIIKTENLYEFDGLIGYPFNNPTKMKIIEETTLLLIEAIQSTCPKCYFPGFTPIQFISGLPCALCSLPTKSIQSKILGCKKCGYELKKEFKKNKPFEDPQFCDYCNP
jgi:hypothetical protein